MKDQKKKAFAVHSGLIVEEKKNSKGKVEMEYV
jgi:hypothetical protein